jgi:hypothetical protein
VALVGSHPEREAPAVEPVTDGAAGADQPPVRIHIASS